MCCDEQFGPLPDNHLGTPAPPDDGSGPRNCRVFPALDQEGAAIDAAYGSFSTSGKQECRRPERAAFAAHTKVTMRLGWVYPEGVVYASRQENMSADRGLTSMQSRRMDTSNGWKYRV